jgi:hypothetical protein
MKYTLALVMLVVAACGSAPPNVRDLSENWPAASRSYGDVVTEWTRRTSLRGQYQEVLELAATFKSPDWRASHAARQAKIRRLDGEARDEMLAQAQAEMAGPYEVELLVTTWDRRENDLDRGKRSVWHVVLVDEQGREVTPLEIVKDKRPLYQLREEFPAYGDFAIAYIARFPRTVPLLGPSVHRLRLRMSSERGGVELVWDKR